MGINEKIKALFNENYSLLTDNKFLTQKKGVPLLPPRIVYDGVVDEDKFSGVVFLLKETTEKGITTLKEDETKDLVKLSQDPEVCEAWDFITTTKSRAEAQGETPENWMPLCYWTEAWKDEKKRYRDAAACGGNLLEVAIVNFKKTTGEGNSENAPLENIAHSAEYAELLRKELELISGVKIVICGGTYELAKTVYGLPSKGGDVEMGCGTRYFKNKDGVVFLEFIHPTQYGTAAKINFTYAYIKEAFSNLKELEVI